MNKLVSHQPQARQATHRAQLLITIFSLSLCGAFTALGQQGRPPSQGYYYGPQQQPPNYNRALPQQLPPTAIPQTRHTGRDLSRRPTMADTVRQSGNRMRDFINGISQPRQAPPRQAPLRQVQPQRLPNGVGSGTPMAQPRSYQPPTQVQQPLPRARTYAPAPQQQQQQYYPPVVQDRAIVRELPNSGTSAVTQQRSPVSVSKRTTVQSRPTTPVSTKPKSIYQPPKTKPAPAKPQPKIKIAPDPKPERVEVKVRQSAPEPSIQSDPEPKKVVLKDTPPVKETKTSEPVAEEKPAYPVAKPAATRGHVISPFAPEQELDVTGIATGELAVDPRNGKIFLVP